MSDRAQKRTRVLVVEDSRTQAAALTMMLEGAGLEVATADSLAAARRSLAAPFDVVMLDLELPDATGLEGVRALVREHPSVPIVVLTSTGGEELAIAALSEGAQDYMPKNDLVPQALPRALRYAIERHRTKNELAALNAEKERLMGVVAHDLRNPLSVVRGYADFLLSGVTGALDGEQDEILRTMRRTTDYMLRLVEDLVDFSRIQAGVIDLEREPTDLAGLIADGIRVNEVLAQQKRIRFEPRLASDVPEVRVDRHKIRQILDNLLTNAVKFSHPDSTVEVVLERRKGEVHLAVHDHGVGIPASDLERVFRPFAKTAARPTAGERSTGLGLAIVSNIVEGHGGRIWVESQVGEGSTFHVTLPL